MFDKYDFFIRYLPDRRKFVLVNYSDHEHLRLYHNKAVALDNMHKYAPFPSTFIIHEMRVRGHNPFAPTQPEVPTDLPWQDWITSHGIFDNVSQSFKRDAVPVHRRDMNTQLQMQPTSADPPSGSRALALNADVIAEILAATRAMPSWKACQIEGTSWQGTGQDNIDKYLSSIGAEES